MNSRWIRLHELPRAARDAVTDPARAGWLRRRSKERYLSNQARRSDYEQIGRALLSGRIGIYNAVEVHEE